MYRIVALLLICVIVACKSNPKTTKTQALQTIDTADFYPIADFIATQIRYVDLRNFTIQKKTGAANFTDSIEINKDSFLQIAETILAKVRNWNRVKHLYKESVFQDLGTASYTINYTALYPTSPIQNIDILLNEQTNILKRLFIKEKSNNHDTTIITQYNWIADRSFQINQSTRTSKHFNTESKLEIKWAQ